MNPQKLAHALQLAAEALLESTEDRHEAPPPTEYSSRHLPPDCTSRARFHAVVKHVPGATKRGRVWFVPRVAWDEARRRRVPVATPAASTPDVTALVERMAKTFRPTKQAS